MGRSAHDAKPRYGESPVTMPELEQLFSEIGRLLEQAERDDDPACLERTLTDGYARALSLEAERWRLQRRIGQMTSTLDRDGLSGATELSSLVRRLEAEEGKIEQLRADLGRLRQRYSDAVRTATA
jgi:ABC-type phosphate transport system auxiliary subunit